MAKLIKNEHIIKKDGEIIIKIGKRKKKYKIIRHHK